MTLTPAQSPQGGGMAAFWRDDYAPLQAAGKLVLEALREDEQAPDADLYRRIVSSGPGSHLYYESGANASLPSPGSSPPPTITMEHRRSVPLPPYLAQQLQTFRFAEVMGLLPEAELAWMSVDDKIYLWSYAASPGSAAGGIENFCSFAVPSGSVVITVGLVRPKKGVFKDVVEWCLVVTTMEEAILCALARSDGQVNGGTDENGFAHRAGALRLVPTRYVISTDNVMLLSVCGTSDGRIFMGGFDGGMYEMQYEGVVDQKPTTLESRLDAFYDGDDSDANWDGITGNNTVAKKIVSSGKRAFSSMTFTSNGSDDSTRPLKCRKLNHSSRAPSLVSTVVPGIFIKAASSILGTGMNSTGGGPIVRMLVDEERSCIYTLSSRGWICVFDLGPPSRSTTSHSAPQAKLAAVLDTVRSARMYLEAVSRGRMYPPSSHSSSVAHITFPGGGASAQAGVGGMDGARSILKVADSQAQRDRNSGRGDRKPKEGGVLTPVSIHIVPRRESGRLTLVAVTEGGLRYYLSCLSSSVVNAGPGQYISSGRRTDPLAPAKKFTLCHIRAPPPVAENGQIQGLPAFASDSNDSLSGFSPKMALTGGVAPRVEASHYDNGTSVLALEWKGGKGSAPSRIAPSRGPAQASSVGDIVIAATPDSVRRKKDVPLSAGGTTQTQTQTLTLSTSSPGGISETLHQPTLPDSSSAELAPTLPGGRIRAICSSASPESFPLFLTLSSQTPTDSELSVGLVPAYFPSSRVRSREKKSGTSSAAVLSSPLNVARASSSTDAPPTPNGGRSPSSIVLTVFTNFLFSRPIGHGLNVQTSAPQLQNGTSNGVKAPQAYRISTRYGFGGAAGKSVRSQGGGTEVSVARPARSAAGSTSTSARLSPWLLRPAVAPLNPFSVQHLISSSESIVALNAGGLHYFQCKTVLSKLSEVIMTSSINIGQDEAVRSFFTSYGYKEGCAMCLSLAVGCGPGANYGEEGNGLRDLALKAAFNGALRPMLVPVSSGSYGGSVPVQQPQSSDPAVPRGHEFRPSSLVDGLIVLLSRLLRPVWYKPAVVVTEGRSIRRKMGGTVNTPARVEFLLDDVTLEEIRKPLYALQALMKETFAPAVAVVPGVQRMDSDRMDVDDDSRSGGYDLFTRAMQQQVLSRSQINGVADMEPRLTPTELETMARLIEERNLHSLYRLLSRTVQLLNLLSLLKRAQLMSDLPEVEWGLLHGLTVSQLVQTRNGQERVENVLNSLVSSTASPRAALIAPSAEADRLASLFASQCYLFFSPGAHLAFEGFRFANAALSCPSSSPGRFDLTSKASSSLKRAARYWCNPQLITGRMLHAKDEKSYRQMALRATEYGSPVAKAASVLMQLNEVDGVVDVCLETASNFVDRRSSQKLHREAFVGVPENARPSEMLFWEQDLYHRRRDQGDNLAASPAAGGLTPTSTSAVAVGADVTPKDAIRTCHAIILYHLSTLLDSPDAHLAKRMVSKCAASSDQDFLHSLYSHLLVTNHVDALLGIEGREVEKWLKRPGADPTLLWRFYEAQGKYALAGEVMWRQARDTQQEASLKKRLEFLTKAQGSYKAALDRSPPVAMQWRVSGSDTQQDPQEIRRMVTQIDDTLEVAMLQDRVLDTVTRSSLRSKLTDSQYSKLSSELVTVSDLYNEFAGALNLFDLCLLILHSCRHNDTKMIETLWRSIICENILPCSTQSAAARSFLENLMALSMVEESVVFIPDDGDGNSGAPLFENGDWTNALKGRVSGLGREVFGRGADYVFPVDFIAATLEGLRRMSSSPTPWPLQVLVDVGVPYFAILGAYEGMVEREERELMGGLDLQRRLQHLSGVIEVLEAWISAAGPSRNGTDGPNKAAAELSRALRSGGLVSRINSYKTSLEGVIQDENYSETVSRLYQKLDDIDNILQRIV